MSEDLINDIIDDRYKIVLFVGEGGMADVYKAHDLITDKDVAIKMIKATMANSKKNLARFDRETRASASLNHQNIVKVLNVGSYKGLPYMVNEFINGRTLKQVLDSRGKFSPIEACNIMYQLCSAVMYAHQHGVIHRDIKPHNIFLTTDGTIKLGDFGIASFQNGTQVTLQDQVIGTPQYIAPEITLSIQASERSDIYSLGVTFFELVTGKVPIDGDDTNEIINKLRYEKFPNIKKFNPNTPQCIEQIIYRATKKEPLDRYPNVEFMRKDIEKIMKNPLILEENHSWLYYFFHKNSKQKTYKNYDKNNAKYLKKASKEVEKGRK